MSYHEDRFYAAVSVLATHGPIKQRLMKAYGDHLEAVEVDELPIALQETFADLRQKMHGVLPTNGEGPICASIRKMSKIQADQCANMVLEMFRDIVRTDDKRTDGMVDTPVAPIPLRAEVVEVVPPFLVKSR